MKTQIKLLLLFPLISLPCIVIASCNTNNNNIYFTVDKKEFNNINDVCDIYVYGQSANKYTIHTMVDKVEIDISEYVNINKNNEENKIEIKYIKEIQEDLKFNIIMYSNNYIPIEIDDFSIKNIGFPPTPAVPPCPTPTNENSVVLTHSALQQKLNDIGTKSDNGIMQWNDDVVPVVDGVPTSLFSKWIDINMNGEDFLYNFIQSILYNFSFTDNSSSKIIYDYTDTDILIWLDGSFTYTYASLGINPTYELQTNYFWKIHMFYRDVYKPIGKDEQYVYFSYQEKGDFIFEQITYNTDLITNFLDQYNKTYCYSSIYNSELIPKGWGEWDDQQVFYSFESILDDGNLNSYVFPYGAFIAPTWWETGETQDKPMLLFLVSTQEFPNIKWSV